VCGKDATGPNYFTCTAAKLAAKCSDGSIASHRQAGGVRAMSALPPIATRHSRRSETSLCAKSGQTHRNKRGARLVMIFGAARTSAISLNERLWNGEGRLRMRLPAAGSPRGRSLAGRTSASSRSPRSRPKLVLFESVYVDTTFSSDEPDAHPAHTEHDHRRYEPGEDPRRRPSIGRPAPC